MVSLKFLKKNSKRVARMSAAICGETNKPRISLRSSGLRLLNWKVVNFFSHDGGLALQPAGGHAEESFWVTRQAKAPGKHGYFPTIEVGRLRLVHS
jgi:hypothetical protein